MLFPNSRSSTTSLRSCRGTTSTWRFQMVVFRCGTWDFRLIRSKSTACSPRSITSSARCTRTTGSLTGSGSRRIRVALKLPPTTLIRRSTRSIFWQYLLARFRTLTFATGWTPTGRPPATRSGAWISWASSNSTPSPVLYATALWLTTSVAQFRARWAYSAVKTQLTATDWLDITFFSFFKKFSPFFRVSCAETVLLILAYYLWSFPLFLASHRPSKVPKRSKRFFVFNVLRRFTAIFSTSSISKIVWLNASKLIS